MSDQTEGRSDAPLITFLPGGRKREQTVLLGSPFEYGGQVRSEVVVRRLNVAEVSAYVEAAEEGEATIPPMLYFADGTTVPLDVLEAMDDDDDGAIFEVMQSFLPRRLRSIVPHLFANDSSPPSGDGAATPLLSQVG